MRLQDAPKDCIRTNSGLFMNVFDTTPEMICIEDIAHALANIPRWGGHLNRHYSVAQHCVNCVRRVKSIKDKRCALMHDGTEGYMCDIASPIKRNLPDYKKIEDKLMSVIFKKYDLEFPLNEVVKAVDYEMLLIEWDNVVINDNPKFKCWSAKRAKKEFLKQFNKLFI